jgi:hypothetical protein
MAVKFLSPQRRAAGYQSAGQVPTAAAYNMVTMLPGRSVYAQTTTVPGLDAGAFTAVYRDIYSGPVVPAGRGRA